MKKFVLFSALLENVSFTNNDYEVKVLGNCLDINAGLGVETGYGRVVKLALSEESFVKLVELSKKVTNYFKIYVGANLVAKYYTTKNGITVKILTAPTQGKFGVNVKGALGLTYKENYSAELNFGFPGYVGISVGGRFSF
ncbi:hypothetical protein [Pseudostreptobacillus hongkongensis]|uniref:hypothetical protein n=1 Tax=Pseudostreptobacillus hongkongensis TaxID=1162717 RepID=UPI0028D38A22|nr:hypothetical protein [Pseudostreptobacillus hongkongensis]